MAHAYLESHQICFSSLVDQAVMRMGLVSDYNKIIANARVSINEAHNYAFYPRDLNESQIVTTAQPHIHTLPVNFKKPGYVEYVTDQGSKKPIKYIEPSETSSNSTVFFYRTQNSLVFSGLPVGTTINFSYYNHPFVYPYYSVIGTNPIPANSAGIVPAYYDMILDKYQYYDSDLDAMVDNLTTTAEETAAQKISIDWMCFNYSHVLLAGILSKTYYQQGAEDRARGYFSEFRNGLNNMTIEIDAKPVKTI